MNRAWRQEIAEFRSGARVTHNWNPPGPPRDGFAQVCLGCGARRISRAGRLLYTWPDDSPAEVDERFADWMLMVGNVTGRRPWRPPVWLISVGWLVSLAIAATLVLVFR